MCISIHSFLSKFEKRKIQPIQKRLMKNNIFKFTKKHLENLLGILSLPSIKLTCFWTTVPRSRLFKNWISIEPGLKLNPIIQFVCFRSLVDENIIYVGKKTRLTFNWLEFVDHLWIELIGMVGKTPPPLPVSVYPPSLCPFYYFCSFRFVLMAEGCVRKISSLYVA